MVNLNKFLLRLVSALVIFFIFVINTNLQAQNIKNTLPYYGKNFNNIFKVKQSTGFTNTRNAKFSFQENMNSEALREELFKILSYSHIEKADQGFDVIVNDCNSLPEQNMNCYKHSKNEYTYSRGYVYNDLDKQNNRQNNSEFVVDVYCQQIYRFSGSNSISNGFQNSRSARSTSREIQHNFNSQVNPPSNFFTVVQPLGEINIEHTWPQSKFSKEFPGDLQKGDLHHLFPSNSRANSIRGNHPFGEVEREESPINNCPSRFGLNSQGTEVYEPVASHRGNVARALFYFSLRYKIAIDPTQEAILRKWNQSDPVDDVERNRNNNIFNIQKNRNPFIDFPDLVVAIKDF